ncbi:MAG: DUF4326 domain-containing protein [Burkholderiaceae bacterium]
MSTANPSAVAAHASPIDGVRPAPRRVRRRRSKDWRLPADATQVARATRWRNPGTVQDCGSAEFAMARRVQWLCSERAAPQGRPSPTDDETRRVLRGRSLACGYAFDGPCRAGRRLAIASDG